ncbi:Gfo/Idh/MocA family protein [Cryptosporangium phraense]|uniref:Gfo/Idh/MocA family oxidoreductase n=1 Tax=Cryptosporangium phraense TaxID=2593070 RepID=A0A545AX11_9ACTN|nr:Gfo/Idh/MocA family oxidoreductase [Cryptosporangium phraense]TQS45858.1 Gfo/Idh/MocA family oxidoreductase [Cryptosporangium phraense]
MDQVSLVVVGAGLRGQGYAERAVTSGGAKIVAVAEPDPGRRERFAARYGVEHTFADWRELVAAGRLADAAIVATPDQVHTGPVIALADLGYHLLAEKPLAPTEDDGERIQEAIDRNRVLFVLCHVLRYTPYTHALKQLLDAGRIGEVVSVQHLEPVGWWHQAHSFVRGEWSNSKTSSPMLLAKACHDLDWLLYLMGRPVRRVSSFGRLTHFRASSRPAEAADRCLDCPLQDTCAYSATRLYFDCLGDPDREFWPLSAVTSDHTVEGVTEALRTGPYGRCVYDSDNDVVDHQVVSLEFADGATGSFTMTAFTPFELRKTRLFGTQGYIDGDGVTLRVVDFRTGAEETVVTAETSLSADHTDGDHELVDRFLAAVASGDRSGLDSDAASALAGHRVVWAAERARLSGTVVELR